MCISFSRFNPAVPLKKRPVGRTLKKRDRQATESGLLTAEDNSDNVQIDGKESELQLTNENSGETSVEPSVEPPSKKKSKRD